MITGGPGSGKSTLARIMGERTGLPIYHMDHIHWKPGWVERPPQEKCALCHRVHIQDQWIFEGNHARSLNERLDRADTVIFLDLPIGLRFWRVIMRMIRNYGQARPDLPQGCLERFDRQTLAFWRWIWTTSRKKLRQMPGHFAQHPHLTVHQLQSRSQVAAFIANLPTNEGGQP